jgi:hypothetical protein
VLNYSHGGLFLEDCQGHSDVLPYCWLEPIARNPGDGPVSAVVLLQ